MVFKNLSPKQQNELNSQFCKNIGLPFNMINEELLQVICKEDKMDYIKVEYDDFIEMVEIFKNPAEYFAYVDKVINKAKQQIMDHEIFQYFKQDNIEIFQNEIKDFKKEHLSKKKEIDYSVDKTSFLYVTAYHPIFTSLSFYGGSKLFLEESTYPLFMKHFTGFYPLLKSVEMYEKIFNFDKMVNEKIITYNEHLFINLVYPALEKFFPIPNFIKNNLISVDKNGILIYLDGFETFDEKDQKDLELCYNITQVLSKRLRELLNLPIECQYYSLSKSNVDWIDFKLKKIYNIYRYTPNTHTGIFNYYCDYYLEYFKERKR